MHNWHKMNNKNLVFISILTFLVFCIGPVDAKRIREFDCSGKIAHAIKRFEKKRYNDVKTILDEVKINCGGNKAMDTALYYLAKANLAIKQPAQASLELEVLVQDFPNSAYREECQYLLGICGYKQSYSYERDQVKTREALRSFEDFVEMFPQSSWVDSARHYISECKEKLVKKEFMSAKFYEKIDQYEAAIVYFRYIIDEYPQSSYVGECKLSLAGNLIELDRPGEAVEVLDELLVSDVDGELKKRAQLTRTRIERKEDLAPTIFKKERLKRKKTDPE